MANPYTPGECTWGAANLASWIPGGLGNADTWYARAPGMGLTTSMQAKVGAAMVFTSGYPGSQGFGHVGIVTGLGPNGYPIIEEMNASRDGGGFNTYDSYQTGPQDLAYLAGYIWPTGSGVSANPNTSATLAGQPNATLTGGLTFNGPFGWLFPQPAVPGGPGYFNSDWIGALLAFSKAAGEVLIGALMLLYGINLIAKESGGPSVGMPKFIPLP